MSRLTRAQAKQQQNRDGGGRYQTKQVEEVDGVNLGAGNDPAVSAIMKIKDDEHREAALEFHERFSHNPASVHELDWYNHSLVDADEIRLGDRLDTGRVVTKIWPKDDDGYVPVSVDGLNHTPWGRNDSYMVQGERVDLSDPDWFEHEKDRLVDAGVEERDAVDYLYRAFSTTDISPLSTENLRSDAAMGRAKVGDNIIFSSPMHGDSSYEVIGKMNQVSIGSEWTIDSEDEFGTITYTDMPDVEYVLKNLENGSQTVSHLRGHSWRRVPAPGDNGISAQRIAQR